MPGCINSTRKTKLANNVSFARSFLARLAGLLGKASLPPGQALAIMPCNSVHTCFMRFSIDVVFTDQGGTVLHLAENLPPYRLILPVRGAVGALELPSGSIKATGTVLGDRLVYL